MTADDVYNVLGVIAGCMFAAGLVPQLYKTIRSGKADDISYAWQGFYITGIICFQLYALHFKLWFVLVPSFIEFVELLTLTILKAVFEYRDNGRLSCFPAGRKKAAANAENKKYSIGDERHDAMEHSEDINGVEDDCELQVGRHHGSHRDGADSPSSRPLHSKKEEANGDIEAGGLHAGENNNTLKPHRHLQVIH